MVTASTLAALHVARLIATARDELAAIIGPLGAHWTWRAVQWQAEDAELWQRPHAVAETMREAIRYADPDEAAAVDWPAWERRGRL